MDSFGSFGLCEEALDYFVEVELPDLSTKKFQFFPRHTVDKIKSKIIGDSPQLSKTSPSDYFLCTTDNERIEIDFVRFIVSHPKITEILEKEPLVKVKLVNKQTFQNTVGSSTLYQNNQSSTSSSLNLQKEKIITPSISIIDLKNNLEKSPLINRIASGGRPNSPLSSPEMKPKKYKEPKDSSTPKKEKKKDKNGEDSFLKVSNGADQIPALEFTQKDGKERLSMSNGASVPVASISEKSTSEKPSGSPLKSFLNSLNDKKKSFTKSKQLSTDDIHYATLRGSQTLHRPKTQEYMLPSISLNHSKEEEIPSSVSLTEQLPPQIQYEYIQDNSLIQESKGFIIESLRKVIGGSSQPKDPQKYELDNLITDDNWYCKYFSDNEHWNYIGEDDKIGTFIVSVTKDIASNIVLPETNSQLSNLNVKGTISRHGSFLSTSGGIPMSDKKVVFKALLRTKNKDTCKIVSVKGLSGSFFNSSNKPPIKDIIQDGFSNGVSCKNIKNIKNQEIVKNLLNFEQNQRIKSFKFGVLYCGPNQTEEDDMFSNEHGSAQFNQFLDFLGQRVPLMGWSSYRGGLDVKSNSTGTHSIYDKYKGFEVMFHVSTLLPHSNVDKQQVDKKRHIGNDIVVIIFKEGDQLFDPKVMRSDFNHVFIVVQPEKNGTYKVSVGYKDGTPMSQPSLEYPSIWNRSQEFKEFLYTKLINSECSSYLAPSFKLKIQRTRLALLKEISSTFTE